jgi:hypothetical protein
MFDWMFAPFFSPDDGAAGDGVTPEVTPSPGGSGEPNLAGIGQQQQTQVMFDPTKHVTKEEASRAVQSRVNELSSRAKQYEAYAKVVQKLAQKTGMDVSQIEQYIDGYGAGGGATQPDPVVLQAQQTALTAGRVALETRRMLEEQALKTDPTYADFDQVKDQVREFADRTGMTLSEAYWAVNGANRAKAIQQEAEQRALANIQKRQGLGAEGDGGADLKSLGLSAEQVQFAKMAGMDPKHFAEMKQVRGLDEYRALKAKK